MLSVLTFADLRAEIEIATARATSKPKKQGWATLRDTVLAAESGPTGGAELDAGADTKQWWLLGLEVRGFRGIPAAGLSITLEPSPGITVIHGPNGSGKSSICDAIDVALHQDTSASLERLSGTGGRAPVWEPVLLHSDGTKASFRVQLLSTENELLSLETHLSGETITTTSGAISTHEAASEQTVHLGETWRSALAAHSPTYAYATWEQRIQLAQDLQKYLEKMLVLGGCFVRVDQAIDDRKAASVAANDEIKAARREAQERMLDAEREYDRTSRVDFAFDFSDDPSAWWKESGMPEGGSEVGINLAPIQTETLLELASRARTALAAFPQGGDGDAVMIHALHDLHHAVETSIVTTDACPVCGTIGAWQAHLEGTVLQNGSVIAATKEWGRALAEFAQEARACMPALLAAAELSANSAISRGLGLVEALHEELLVRAPAAEESRVVANQLLDLVASQDFTREASATMERASAESAWVRRQCVVLTNLREVWISKRKSALDLQQWLEARHCLDDLAKRLKGRRQEALESATNKTVTALLRDAGLVVAKLNVQKRQADFVLRDKAGRELELGMLSAGQRNAVLLAPALAVAEGGPFQFMVIDDPVHSFDELRVDQVARQIIDLSRTRRVIVLTHDERLREHLLASPTPVDSRSVRRDPMSGVVEVQQIGPMWSVLLDDAELLADLANLQDPSRLFLTNTIRGLCRQAVDNALRLLITREAVRQLTDPNIWIAQLDASGINTTAQRLDAAEALDIGSECRASVASARATLKPFMKAWNMAAHGNPPEGAVSGLELQAARSGCAEITK